MARQKTESILSIVMGVALTAISFVGYFGGVRFTTGAWGAERWAARDHPLSFSYRAFGSWPMVSLGSVASTKIRIRIK
jgi:hypothetical protein